MTTSGNRIKAKKNGSTMKIPADHTGKIISPTGSTSSAVATVIPRLLAWVNHPIKKSWWPSVLYPTWKDAAKDAKILHNPQTHIRIHTCTNLVSIEDLAKNRVPGKVAISRHPGIVICYYLGLSQQQQQQQNKSIVAATEMAVEWDVTKSFQGYRCFYDQALQSHTQHGNMTLDPDFLCALEEAYVFLGSQDTQLLRGIPTAAANATTSYISEKKRSLSNHPQEQPNKRLHSNNPGNKSKIILQNTPQWYHEWEEDPTQPSQHRDPSQFTQSFAVNGTTDQESNPKPMQDLLACRNQSVDITTFVNPTHPVDNDQKARASLSKESQQKQGGSATFHKEDESINAEKILPPTVSTVPLSDNSPKSSTYNQSTEDGNVLQQQVHSPTIMEASLENTTSTKISEHNNVDAEPITSHKALLPTHLTPIQMMATHLSEKEDHNPFVINSYTEDALHAKDVMDTNAVQADICIEEESSQRYAPSKQIAPSLDLTVSMPSQYSSNQDEKKSTSPLPKVQPIDIGMVLGKAPTMEQQQLVWVSTPEANVEQTIIEQNTSPTVTWDSKTHDRRSQHDDSIIKVDTFNEAEHLSVHVQDVVVPIQTTAVAASADGETNFDQGQNYPTPKSKNTHRAVTPFSLQQQVPTALSAQHLKEDHEASCLSKPHEAMSSCSSLLSPDEKFIEECLEEENLEADVWFFTQ
jgi:hypothetical protein